MSLSVTHIQLIASPNNYFVLKGATLIKGGEKGGGTRPNFFLIIFINYWGVILEDGVR